MQRILVTGAAGAIGYHLSKYLADLGFEIYAVDNFLRGKKDKYYRQLISKPNVFSIEVDLSNPTEINKLPKNIDYIFHLAAYNGTQNFYERPFSVLYHSTLPTINLLEYYRGVPIKKFIYAGTSEAYASTVQMFNWKVPTAEDVPLCIDNITNPRWSYAVSKIHGEMAIISAATEFGLNYLIIRYHNVYGPRMGDKHVIPDFIQRVKKGIYELYGCHNTRTFLYVKDAVEATVKLAFSTEITNDIFNVGSEYEITILELGKLILKLMNQEDKEIKCFPAPKGSILRRVPDITKLKKAIGFKPKYSLEEGLKETINYYIKEEIAW